MKITVLGTPIIHVKKTKNGWNMSEESPININKHQLQTERKPKPKEK